MMPTGAPSSPPPLPTAGAAPADEALAQAFPALDASDEELAQLTEVPPDPLLLAAAPPPQLIDVHDLEEEVAHTRVIFVRGAAAIPLTALLAIIGSLLFHGAIISSFILALYFSVRLIPGDGPAHVAADPGGSGIGYMASAPPAAAIHNPDLDSLLAHAAPPPLPSIPLPSLSDAATPSQLATSELASRTTDAPLIGIPADHGLGQPKPLPPPSPTRLPPKSAAPDRTLVVAPPPSNDHRDPLSTNTALASTANSASHNNAPRNAYGEGDDNGNEPFMPLTKSDAAGHGDGRGSGDGLDRGGSGANNPQPTLLEWPSMPVPEEYQRNPPTRDIVCSVTVLASGRVDKVEITQSCGQTALDELWRTGLMHAKFHPAYRAGKPYTATYEATWKFAE